MLPDQPRRKRNRATALVFRDGRLLLVRERGAKLWSLPGGGMKRGEQPLAAAIRELYEETQLTVTTASFLFCHETPSQLHHVCHLVAEGTVQLQRQELGDHRWWDGETPLSIIASAREIVGRAEENAPLFDIGLEQIP